MECLCAQTKLLSILSSYRVLGNGVRTHVNYKEKIPFYRRLRGGSSPRRSITEDSELNTLPTELFRPPRPSYLSRLPGGRCGQQSAASAGNLGMIVRSGQTGKLQLGTPATAPDACWYEASAWTGWPGVTILRLGEKMSLVWNSSHYGRWVRG